MTLRRLLVLGLAGLAIGLAGLVASCGGGGASPTPTPSPNPHPDRQVELVKKGYTFYTSPLLNTFGCGLVLHNKSKTEGVTELQWIANFYDATGTLVGQTGGVVHSLFPDETRGVAPCNGSTSPKDATITEMQTIINVCETCWQTVITTKRPSIQVTDIDKRLKTLYTAHGTATNPFSVALDNVFIPILSFNAAGDILASNGVNIGSIPPDATVDWSSQVYVNFEDNSVIDHIEPYIEPQALKLDQVTAEP